ncbi:hypothetical protein BDD14_1836 [Edaphobacter modestus]|uniref:Uncharacterized protein n=1 Tax=Edaphobacter modestus TaxID=388466 RepID=A0A4Q7YRG3_9BACT|nr:hypothetical protein BDD14_1836 [Edaphobacter modestus]
MFAAKVTLGGQNRGVPEQELNLLKFASVHVAQLRADSAQIMRGGVLEFNTTGTIPNNVPNHIFRNPPTPSCSVPTDCSEDPSVCHIRCGHTRANSAFELPG